MHARGVGRFGLASRLLRYLMRVVRNAVRFPRAPARRTSSSTDSMSAVGFCALACGLDIRTGRGSRGSVFV